jgi:hypothetical protein
MTLVRYGPAGREKPGLIDADGKLRDLSRKVKDIDGNAISPSSLALLRKVDTKRLPLVEMGMTLACGAYGLTESYGQATVHEADDPLDVKLANNGRALPGMTQAKNARTRKFSSLYGPPARNAGQKTRVEWQGLPGIVTLEVFGCP